MFLFAITDIDTQQNLQSFFGRTKITRLQKGANPKAKPDAQEVEIELIDDNIIKMLETGHHITYMPKEKGTLYVGYTKYPNVPKTQEGYIRQGRDVEDDFILFKQGLLVLKKKEPTKTKRVVPPEVLYLAVDNDMLDTALTQGLNAPKNDYIHLHKNQENALNVKKNKEHVILLKIDTKQMYKDGIIIFENTKNKLFLKKIASKYLSQVL